MYLLDENNQLIDSECSLDMLDGEQCLIIESSGGANPARGVTRRNPDYNKLVGLVLRRLAGASVRITRVVLDSKKVEDLPIEDRIAVLDRHYPVDLSTCDTDEFRRVLGRSIAGMHRRSNAKSGGNAQKRIRICLERPIAPDVLIAGECPEKAIERAGAHAPALTETEVEYIHKARKGQGQFRKCLLERFNSTCPVTGITNPDLLIASHIKPWKACNNTERLDPANGVLLSALADQLFDKGLITFTSEGNVISSKDLCDKDRKSCDIDSWAQITLDDASEKYLAYHRTYQYRQVEPEPRKFITKG
ncbi:HNH endonuclease [Pontiellaceae bacterium B12227]|nr:HNH endonuclease [Pontiellaceae bacterium B12227]